MCVYRYHSSVDEASDIASGLFGTIVIYRQGTLGEDGIANDVNKEFVLAANIVDESTSPYYEVICNAWFSKCVDYAALRCLLGYWCDTLVTRC